MAAGRSLEKRPVFYRMPFSLTSSSKRPRNRAALPLAFVGGATLFLLAGQALQNEAEHRQNAHVSQKVRENEARQKWETIAKKAAKERNALYAISGQRYYGRIPKPRPNTPPPTRAALLTRNQETLADFRAALKLPYRVAPDDDAARQNGTHSRVSFVPLFRLLQMDGDEKANQHDYAGAADAYEDMIEAAQILPRGGTLDPLFESDAFEQMGRDGLWRIAGKINAQAARRAIRRLEALLDDNESAYADALAEEKKRGEAQLAKLFDDPQKLMAQRKIAALLTQMQTGRNSFGMQMQIYRFSVSSPKKLPVAPPPTLWGNMGERWEKWKTLNEFDTKMNTFSFEADLPYQVRRKNTQARMAAAQAKQNAARKKGKNAPPVSLTQSMALSSFSGFGYGTYGSPGTVAYAGEEWTKRQTQQHFLLLALALAAYQKEHDGKIPAHLSDLVPAYLVRVPVDPYSYPVAPLCWKPDPKGRLAQSTLYSVGEDGADDGGVRTRGSIRQGGGLGGFGFGGYGYGGYGFSSVIRTIGKGDWLAPKLAP